MARISPKTTWKLAKAIKGRRKHETAKSGSAKVSKVDGSGTVWVRPLGASVDVPVNGSSVARAKVGDTVTYETGDGRLKVTGNSTDPAVGAEGAKMVANDVVVEATKPIAKRVADASDTAQKAAAAAKAITDAIGQFFWHDTSGAHVSTEEGNPDAAQNTIWNSLGMLFRKGTYNVLAVVTGSDPGVDIYDGTGNAGSNILAALHGSGLRMGRANESHMEMDYHSMRMVDKEGHDYLYVSDLRGRDGYYEITEHFTGDGSTVSFQLDAKLHEWGYSSGTPVLVAAYVDDVETEASISSSLILGYLVDFSTAPAEGSDVMVVYKSDSRNLKSYTLGLRNPDGDIGIMSLASGLGTTASGFASHAEGHGSTAIGDSSHAEGNGTASGDYSHAEGSGTASGNGSHAEGGTASGEGSHAEGTKTQAIGDYSHAEGEYTRSRGRGGHAEGYGSSAWGDYSHAEGASSAWGARSHSQNNHTIAAADDQTAMGRYNEEDTNGDYALIIGNGTGQMVPDPDNPQTLIEDRSNAFTVDWDGIIGAGASETQVAISSDVRTVTHNVVHSNGVCCSITLNVRNNASIASGGSMSVGTVPDGYRPAYTVYEACSSGSASGMSCYMSLSSTGAITVYNRSSASLTANSVLAATLTFAL